MSLQLSDFESLVGAIADVHEHLSRQAVKAVNTGLTLRNWLIGCYVHQYELGGRDRASYGEQLIGRLADRLRERGVPRTDARELRRYRQFFLTYPKIRDSLSPELAQALPKLPAPDEIRDSPGPECAHSGRDLLQSLSFTHFRHLLAIDDPVKRTFYEVQSLRGRWSVRELQRQIASLLYERTGLARDKAATVALAEDEMRRFIESQMAEDLGR